jgi:hypothetical protein
MSEEKTFLGNVRDRVENGLDWIKDKSQQEGSGNWLIAAPAMLLGFLASQTLIGNALGGGFLAQVAGIGLSITAAMAMGVFATKSFHTVKNWALDEVPNAEARVNERAAGKAEEPEKAAPTKDDQWREATQAVVNECRTSIEFFQVNGIEGESYTAQIDGAPINGTIRDASCTELAHLKKTGAEMYVR